MDVYKDIPSSKCGGCKWNALMFVITKEETPFNSH